MIAFAVFFCEGIYIQMSKQKKTKHIAALEVERIGIEAANMEIHGTSTTKHGDIERI